MSEGLEGTGESRKEGIEYLVIERQEEIGLEWKGKKESNGGEMGKDSWLYSSP